MFFTKQTAYVAKNVDPEIAFMIKNRSLLDYCIDSISNQIGTKYIYEYLAAHRVSEQIRENIGFGLNGNNVIARSL